MSGFQKILEKYHLEKWFQKENLVVLILSGILLIVIALPTKDEDDNNSDMQKNPYEFTGEENAGESAASESTEKNVSTEDYVSQLEEKLVTILSHIEGVGEVHVMITLQESEELVVEKDLLESQEQTIYETEGNQSTPYVVKTIFPKVEGVVVVAEGAGTGKVTQHITEAVQALFNIEIHKIKVTGS